MAKQNAEKPNFFVRVGKWFKALPFRVAKSFKNMYLELKIVTWPTKSALINYSVVVLLFMVVMGVAIGLFDTGASALIRWITG